MIAYGTVRCVEGGFVDVAMPALSIGSTIRIARDVCSVLATVVAADGRGVRAEALGSTYGIACGAAVVEEVSRGSLAGLPLRRAAVCEPFWSGVRAIDALLTLGRGARVGIFGGPGLGKSTLLETIVRGAAADAVVLALVGERGREAHRWYASSDRRTTIVCATSDRPASERVGAANSAFARAEMLARRGLHVLLVLDSLARFAFAVRDMAIARGEAVGRAGFPPSVFAEMARLLERAGSFETGSITAVATVLSDGEDRDPVSEAARSLLDGHVQLCPRRAHAGHFPAIDLLASSSRTMSEVVDRAHLRSAATVRAALALLEASRDARAVGIEPADPATRRAIEAEPVLDALLRQGWAPEPPERALEALARTADTLEGPYEYQF